MLRELLEPSLSDGDTLTFWVVVTHLEAIAGGLMDNVCHVLLPQVAKYAEEELQFRQLVRELLIGW